MPLINRLREKWQEKRAERASGEESRYRVLESLNFREKDLACQEIARCLKEADGNSLHSDGYYYSQAKQRIAGFRWQLYKLNRPCIWLAKKVIEPLDFWADRANLLQFFAKVSPFIQAIGVLAIPFVILIYESRREAIQIEFEIQRDQRQEEFQQNLVSAQAQVRQQEAVRDYLSQITSIYLDSKGQENIRRDKDLKQLLEATTLAIFDELSVSEDFRSNSSEIVELNENAIDRDRKGDVIDFLSKLGWINSYYDDEEPLLSLNGSNLFQADLSGASLRGVDLTNADLSKADLSRASLFRANLRLANLREVDMRGAQVNKADLSAADLAIANLSGSSLSRSDLSETDLSESDLSKTDLREVNLSGAYMIDTELEGAIFCTTIMSDGSLNNSDCE